MRIGNIEVYGIIYKITNKANGKVYIGQTVNQYGFKGRYSEKGIGVERVYKHHKRIKKVKGSCNTYLLNSIEKYGFTKFEVCEILDVSFSEVELNIKEEIYIKTYKSTDRKYGYNFKNGGNSSKFSGDAKNKEGVEIMCLNDGKLFKSKKEAGDYYGITTQYINKALNKKFYSDYRNFGYLRFKKLKRRLDESEKFCTCCGCIFKMTYITKSKAKNAKKIYNKSSKYCEKCKSESYRKNKDKDKDKNFKMKVFYTYKNKKESLGGEV